MSSQRRKSTHRKPRRGVIVVIVAISLVVILALAAIAFDGGALLARRRKAQATADAAALAAAEELFRSWPKYQGLDVNGTAADDAYAVAALNGFYNDGATVVQVRTSPQKYAGGPNAGTPLPEGYVEVTVQANQKRYFSALLGEDDIPVGARAVARGVWGPMDIAILVLDLHRSDSFKATGESFATVTGAQIMVNSDAPDALSSSGGVVSAPEINITGGSSISGTKGAFYGDINYGVPPIPDPLRHIPEPEPSNFVIRSQGPTKLSNGTKTVAPGLYKGGISVSGQGTLIMQPGIYYMDGGGFDFAGQGDLNALEVMIYNAPVRSSDVISITGTGNIVMSPPASGLYKGLTLFQDRQTTNTITVSGGGYMHIIGTFYTAEGTLKVGGGGDGIVGSQYISRFLETVGNGGFTIDYIRNGAIPRRVLHLVE